MDTDLLWFGVRMWDLRVTDLMQGPVYGIETEESKIDDQLRTLFNYDEIFGTIVNRFITQAVVGYPLTVYGAGGQTRGYLNIKDTLQCVHMSEKTPAQAGELRIFNQIMETFSVNELAEMTRRIGEERGHAVTVESIENPRKEAEEHYYNPTYQGLQQIGVDMMINPDLAARVKAALDFVAANPKDCEAQTVIMYSWNEHSEGGGLCPTMGKPPKYEPVTTWLDEVAGALAAWKYASLKPATQMEQ